jgi:O-acetyl-ADP-ribose deacetylase (regulator of RNase III)
MSSSNSLDIIIQELKKQKSLQEAAEILERNKDFILEKLQQESEDLKEALGKEEQEIQEAIKEFKEKLLIERIKESVKYFSNLKGNITDDKGFTGLLSRDFYGSLQNKIKGIQEIKIRIEEKQIDNLEQLLDFLAEKFYEETTVTENGQEKKISNIDKIKFKDFSKFLKENSVFSLIQVYESLLILVRGQEETSEKGKVIIPSPRVLKEGLLKEEPFDEGSLDIVLEKVHNKYVTNLKETGMNEQKIATLSDVRKYLGIFPLLYILDLDSIQKIIKTFKEERVKTIKGHIKDAYEALLEGLENIKKEIDKETKSLDRKLKQKIDNMDTNEKQKILQELEDKLKVGIVQKNPKKASGLVNVLTGELKRIKNISFFRNYFFFRDLIDILKVHHQKKELESMIEEQEKLENQISVEKAKLSIEERNFSLRAFNVFTPGHYITFGLNTKKGNDLVTVKFDNTRGFITKKTLTNFTKVHIDSDFFENQGITNPKNLLFSTVVYQQKSNKKPEIIVKKTIKKRDEILKEISNKEIKIKDIDQLNPLQVDADVEIYFIVVRLYAIYEENRNNLEISVFLFFILRLILLKTILDRRVLMMIKHMKDLKEIIQGSNVQEIAINNPKSYSINKRIEELGKQKIETDNIEYLFRIGTFLELKQIATQGQYEDLEKLLPEKNNTLNKIKKFYDSLLLSSQDYNGSLKKSLDILSKIAIVMDEFSWRVKNSEIKNEDDFLRIVLNYYQMLSLLSKINQISEIFKLFEEGVENNKDREQKLKTLFNSLSSMAMKICEAALECQPFNLYTLRTTLGFFYKISLKKDYEPPKTQGDGIELTYKEIVDNLNFLHYRQVSECLGISKEVIKSLEKKSNKEIKNATLEIFDNMGLELCKNKQLAEAFYRNVAKILEKPQDVSKKPQSLIIPVVDQNGKEIQGQKIGRPVSNANRRTLKSPKRSTEDFNNLENILTKITKKNHKKLLEIVFTNERSFSVVQGSIGEVNYAHAVVNAANGWLRYGGGITESIFNEAGISLGHLENYLAEKKVKIPDGFAVISDGFELRKSGVNFIIHAVGPNLQGKEVKDAISSLKDISYAVKNAISIGTLINNDPNRKKINERAINNMETIVIPLISGGIFSGDLGSKGYNFIIMSNLAAIFHALINTKEEEAKNFPNDVILIEFHGQKVDEILSCVITLCKAVSDEIQEVKY